MDSLNLFGDSPAHPVNTEIPTVEAPFKVPVKQEQQDRKAIKLKQLLNLTPEKTQKLFPGQSPVGLAILNVVQSALDSEIELGDLQGPGGEVLMSAEVFNAFIHLSE